MATTARTQRARTSAAPGLKAANLVTLSSAGIAPMTRGCPTMRSICMATTCLPRRPIARWLGPWRREVPLTGPKTFDRVYDPSTDPLASTNNSQAITTNLFYILNWMHDYFYDAGWTESALNPQKSNKGSRRHRRRSDSRRAQDSGGRNNANASTPADGGMPNQIRVGCGRRVGQGQFASRRRGRLRSVEGHRMVPIRFRPPAAGDCGRRRRRHR